MEIKWQYKGRVFCLSIGHTTKWFSQAPWITLIEEFYEGPGRIKTYAKMLWSKH